MKKLIHNLFSLQANVKLTFMWVILWINIFSAVGFKTNNALLMNILKLGIPLSNIHGLYWRFWFKHYLNQDRGWHETKKRMLSNSFCPFDVAECYEGLLNGEEGAIKTFRGLCLEKELENRHKRCQLLHVY